MQPVSIGKVLYVNKSNSVIHTTPGIVQVSTHNFLKIYFNFKRMAHHSTPAASALLLKNAVLVSSCGVHGCCSLLYIYIIILLWCLYSGRFNIVQIKPEPTSMSQMQGNDSNSDDSYSDDDSPKRRRDLLTRRPSYHRILKDITSPDMAGELMLFKCVMWCSYFM